VYGISTEDMDSLTFGTPKLIRHLMAPVSQGVNPREFDYQTVGAGGRAPGGMVLLNGGCKGGRCCRRTRAAFDYQAMGG